MQPDLVARELLTTALGLFQQRGYAQVDLSEIATAAECSLDQLYLRFPRKEALILSLYDRTLQQLQLLAADAPNGTVPERFEFLMRNLLGMLKPNRPLFRHLLPAMLDPDSRLGVLGPATDRIRLEVQGVYTLLVLGATDAPSPEQTKPLVELLYFAHLGLIFLFLQDQRDNDAFLENNLALACDLIGIARQTILRQGQSWLTGKLAHLAGFPNPTLLADRVERLVQDYIHPPHDSTHFFRGRTSAAAAIPLSPLATGRRRVPDKSLSKMSGAPSPSRPAGDARGQTHSTRAAGVSSQVRQP